MVWIPVIILRAFLFGRWTLWLDMSLAAAGLVCVLTTGQGADFHLFWMWLPGYFVLGVVIFVLSSMATTRTPIPYFQDVLRSIVYSRQRAHLQVICAAFGTALLEESVWRAIFQTVLSHASGHFLAIVLVACSFTLLHRHSTSGFTLQWFELLVFSLTLGILFAVTHDLLAVVVVHGVRNYLIGIRRVANDTY